MAESEITELLGQLNAGDRAALSAIWEECRHRLTAMARKNLPKGLRALGDEEDVVQSAYLSFVKGATCGNFPRLEHRADLWGVLGIITKRKAWAYARRATKQGPRLQHEPGFRSGDADENHAGVENLPGDVTPAEAAAIMAEEIKLLIEGQKTELEKKIAICMLNCLSVEETAKLVDRAVITVERHMRNISVYCEGQLNRWQHEKPE